MAHILVIRVKMEVVSKGLTRSELELTQREEQTTWHSEGKPGHIQHVGFC